MSKKVLINPAHLTDTLMANFFALTEPQADGCLLWIGHLTCDGYGKFTVKRASRSAHRVALTWANGVSVDPDLEVDHLCRNRACVNPEHLEEVSHQENMRRSHTPTGETMRAVAATGACASGHDMSAPNAWLIWPSGRACRLCNRERGRVRRIELSKDPAYKEKRHLQSVRRKDAIRIYDAARYDSAKRKARYWAEKGEAS